MPLHLTSRRQFIAQLGAGFAAISPLRGFAAGVDENLIAILNDTHIGAQQPADSTIPANLRTTIDWLLAQPKLPAAVVINGDLALKDGQRGDYEHFAQVIAPLREAGVSLHLTMGNHDDRAVFFSVLKDVKPETPVVESKYAGIIGLPAANLILLDSLKATMVTQGLLGPAQRDWLSAELERHQDKPALLFAHHNPRLGGDPRHFPGGLEDSESLWKAITPRKQVKAYIHGHIHHRDVSAHEGIHILNTPATSFVADKTTSTTGWTMARLFATGATFTTHTHLAAHPWNGESVTLEWRS